MTSRKLCSQCLNLHRPVISNTKSSSVSSLSNSRNWTIAFLLRNVHASTRLPQEKTPTEPVESPPHPAISAAVSTSRQPTIIDRVARGIASVSPNTGETYQAYSKGQELYLECARLAAYKVGKDKIKNKVDTGAEDGLSEQARFWYETCNRDKTFNSWANATILHIWTLIVRFRAFSDKEKTKIWERHLVDHFFYDAEEKMEKEYGIKSGSSRSRYLKDLFVQYRGQVAAYDEGFAKSDAVLATALWRNIFDAKPDVNFEVLAMVTSYVRRILSGLGRVSDETICSARLKFGDPRNELGLVRGEVSGLLEKQGAE